MENKRKASTRSTSMGDFIPSQQKRPRGGDWNEDSPSQFEEELAFLDEVEAEVALEMKEAQLSSDAIPLGELQSCKLREDFLRQNKVTEQ